VTRHQRLREILGPELPSVSYEDDFRRELRAWLADNPAPAGEPDDEGERFDQRRAWQGQMASDGWVGLHWPVEHGGRGAGPLTQFMYYEELALAGVPEPANTAGLILLGPTLMALGSPELQRRFLPSILSGAELWCQGFSEPDAGSDLASMRTSAHLDDDEWVIAGQKTWTTMGHYADYCFVLCRTDPESERHRGLTMLICPTDQPGVEIRPIRQISGDHEFSEVWFDQAKAPAGWIVGEVGQGWAAAMTLFQFERGDQGYTDHGRMLVRLDEAQHALALSLAAGRVSRERASAVKEELESLWVRCQGLRLLNYRGALLSEAGEGLGAIGSLTNLVWGELEKDLAEACAEVCGVSGVLLANPESRRRLAGRAASIYSGTSEIQRNIIAERLLGMPR
jgi:alkylation response protein AidB-like acyl-CoA dehydrogenase